MPAQNELVHCKRPHVLIINSCRAAVRAIGAETEAVDWYLPTVVSSLREAAELLRNTHFDVVASDVTEDGGGGLALPSLLLDLRNRGELSEIPSVLLCSPTEDAGINAHARLARRVGMSVGVVSSLENSAAKNFIRGAAACPDEVRAAGRIESAVDERDLIQSLLTEGDVRTVVQPRVELSTGKIVGALATARWNHPELGDVPPSQILSLANESGLNVLLFHRMSAHIAALLRTMARLDQQIPIAVGVSAETLCMDDLAQKLEQRLASANIDKRLFVLELTADDPVPDLLALSTAMGILRLHGFSVSMGAFGRGGTTLGLLAQLPFSALKIDHLLVKEMHVCSTYDAVVSAAIRLGHDLDMRVVAGGVDSQENVAALIARGCDIGQGAAFSPPLEIDDFVAMISRSKVIKPTS